jgi:Uma2 family endonuclease
MTDDGGIQTMTIAILPCAEGRLTLNLSPWPDLSEEGFLELCAANPDLRLEWTAKGEIVIRLPEDWATSHRNVHILSALGDWTEASRSGIGFDSSAGFRLPNGAILAPDAAWVRGEQLAGLTAEQMEGIPPLAPDFVIELLSPADWPPALEAKMAEYAANGVRLGWLIDPFDRTVTMYRPGQEPRRLTNPTQVAGDPELPGFVLELEGIWRESGLT